MASMRPLCDWLGRDRRHGGVQPWSESLPYQSEYCAPIFENRFHPCEAPHLRKINSPETEACDKDVDAITQWLVIERIHRLFDCLRTVRVSPPNSYLVMSFVDAHLQRRMCHSKGYELLPVLRTREPPSGFQSFVERRRRQWRQQAKDWQPRDRKSTRLNSSHTVISYAVFCLKKKKTLSSGVE